MNKLKALIRHRKIPVAIAREALESIPPNVPRMNKFMEHPDLTHEDYSKLRTRTDLNKDIDWDLVDIPHLPHETQLAIIKNPIIKNPDENLSYRRARYIVEENKDPHPEVIEKASEKIHQSYSPNHLAKMILDNNKSNSKAISNVAAYVLTNNNQQELRHLHHSLLSHPNITKSTIKYIHDNSWDDLHNESKKYL